ncbi:MAG: type II toxin-antitoxin system HicB family antitoxin [Ignavibacteria bacterium]|nr:type II toxin-antitoxin system HicB family antitoxin [Ignavibacteria bacterium]
MKYAIIIEEGPSNYSAYVPDLPGCVSAGDTIEDVKANIRDAIVFHIEGMKDDGVKIPLPTSISDSVEVAA